MRFRLAIFILLGGLLPPDGVQAEAPSPLAVTDPAALRQLDVASGAHPGLGLGRMLDPGGALTVPLANDALFAMPAMAGIRSAIGEEFARYLAEHTDGDVGIGAAHAIQLFDRALLTSGATRFVLAGIVDRMDRAYVAPATCGEVRLIYRLTRIAGVAPGAQARLPMTLNLVLHAKRADDAATSCADLARRWLAVGALPHSGPELAADLVANDGALALLSPDLIDRIEINLQIAHRPKSEAREFRTDYLQKVFRLNATTRQFEQAHMENQIDRDRILASDDLRAQFKSWLLDLAHLAEFDRGTVLIPEKFLATGAVAATPAGLAPSNLQPAFGLMQSDGGAQAVFSDDDVVAALAGAVARGILLQNIRSPAGFARRLNDISCGGCHQIRGIGGFHFPGADSLAAPNSANVPASPHFVGDQPRRRAIAVAIQDGKTPDFSRGFSDRPQPRGSAVLAGSEYLDGWGATCYRPATSAAETDKSFASWKCASGLSCQPIGDESASRFGMCFVATRVPRNRRTGR
ncbi:hypothetical protein BH11PSE4_BH11PSE4_38560 [soil metagenome]